MRAGRAVILGAALALCSEAALACSPPPATRIEFEGGSDKPTKEIAAALGLKGARFSEFSPKCSLFRVKGYMGVGSSSTTSDSLAALRVTAVSDVLKSFGASPELVAVQIEAIQNHTEVDARLNDNQIRSVDVAAHPSDGHWRCDPASRNWHYQGGVDCKPLYSRCYLELADGTICNFNGVADPNPAKYSVTQ